MRVLFCTDGSKISFDALKNFSHYAKSETIVDTICVIDWSFLPEEVIIEDAGFTNSCRNIADTILEHAQEVIKECDLSSGEIIKQCGAAIESILEQLDNQIYDTVILGSHGKKGIQIWLGSVSREILEAARVPVYISKEKRSAKRILFTADGTEDSKEIIKKTLELINLDDSEIYICTVTENPDLLFLEGTLDTNWLMAIQNQQEIYSEKSLNSIKDFFTQNNIAVKESIVLTGTPAQSIINYAKEKQIDLVVMGAKTKTKMQKFLLDSVSKRVVENTNSDTLVFKI